jgi:hypothetical protein
VEGRAEGGEERKGKGEDREKRRRRRGKERRGGKRREDSLKRTHFASANKNHFACAVVELLSKQVQGTKFKPRNYQKQQQQKNHTTP